MLASIRMFFAVLGRLSPTLAGRLAAALFARPRKYARPQRERALMARGLPLHLNAGLRATAWGSGPTVLLVHGWEGRGAQLGAFVDPLVAEGYRVVALDGPAHGDSLGSATTGPAFADAIVAAQRTLGALAAVIAHSFGGFTSLLALTRGLEAERLVSIAAPSSVPEVLTQFTQMIRLPPQASPAMVRALEAMVDAPIESFEVDRFGRGVTVPVLVVHDTDDKEVPYADAARWERALGARLLTTTGLGHRRILFTPDVVRTIVDFVGEGRTAPARRVIASGDP